MRFMHTISTSDKQTREISREILDNIEAGEEAVVIGLRGDLGSGKTTFVKGLAQALGVGEHVTSPTFVIEKIYTLKGRKFDCLVHVDAYRLESGGELEVLGWKETISNNKNLVVIEWPERVSEVMPKNTAYIDFEFIDENKRKIVSKDA